MVQALNGLLNTRLSYTAQSCSMVTTTCKFIQELHCWCWEVLGGFNIDNDSNSFNHTKPQEVG